MYHVRIVFLAEWRNFKTWFHILQIMSQDFDRGGTGGKNLVSRTPVPQQVHNLWKICAYHNYSFK